MMAASLRCSVAPMWMEGKVGKSGGDGEILFGLNVRQL
jgi:hypothetical protein